MRKAGILQAFLIMDKNEFIYKESFLNERCP